MNERIFNFAHTLLQTTMPLFDVYQESLTFAKALDTRDFENVIAYSKITAELMEQVAQAVLAAQKKIEDDEMRKYREISEQRAQANDQTNWNWVPWERKS